MINHVEAQIQELWIHFIGNHNENEGVKFSAMDIPVQDEVTHQLLSTYFFENFPEPQYYHFTFSDGNHQMNPMFTYVQEIFNDPSMLVEHSKSIALYLYNNSKHPNIKSGDLLVSYVKDLLVDDELCDGICIFKSENKDAFLTLDYLQQSYHLGHQAGINIGKLDKACIIFNTEASEGYKICAIDRSNRAKDAQFWMDSFLNIVPRSDDYYHTKNVIQATKQFIHDRVKPLYDIDKGEEADMLTRSRDYLSNEENFDQGEYARKVFKNQEVVEQFEFFREDLKSERNIELADNFSVNLTAVKNQSKVFKSVLKLDKNFHVYIHGNRNMIERGTDGDGRKYYKLYYEEER